MPVIEGVRRVISDLHLGKLSFTLRGQRPKTWRWAPSVIPNQKPCGPETSPHPYTVQNVATVLGLTRSAGRGYVKALLCVELTFRLLELRELGKLSESELVEYCSGANSLGGLRDMFPLKEVVAARAEHVASLSRTKKFSYGRAAR